jgi:serine/threonine-protein kinase HipA
MKTLAVCFYGKQVGALTQDELGKFSFQYEPAWLQNPQAQPLSQSLPLRSEAFEEKECAGFFGGLLPEDHNRELIARNLGITAGNDFAMLKAIGGECAGAIALLDPDADMPSRQQSYHPVSEDELVSILNTLPRKPLLAGEAEVRLSLAGAQNKLALYRDEKGFALPLHESPSTYILKPESNLFPGLVENEAACLRLARAVDLPGVEAEPMTIGPHRCLLVKRYDRHRDGGHLHRIHQEDFCQAMGISSRYKYQSEGGPSLVQCFELVRKASARPAKDLITLFEAVLFNYLIGNNDAHGKNFSLLYVPDGNAIRVELAPLYDVVCTAAYPELSQKMAMKIGSKYLPADLRLRHWEAWWQSIGFSIPQARRQTLQFMEKTDTILLEAAATPVEQQICDIARERREILSRTLASAYGSLRRN